MDPTVLTSGQAAARLGISKRTLLRLVQRGALHPVLRSPGGWLRFRAADIEAYAPRLSAAAHEPQALPGIDRLSLEARYRLIASLTSDYAYSFTVLPDGTRVVEWMSGSFEAITGYTVEDMRTQRVQVSLIHPDDLPIVAERTRTLLAGQPASRDYRILTRSGEVRWVRDHARPFWDRGHDRVAHIVGAAQDITAQKQAEQEAQRGRAAAEELARLRQDQAEEAEAMARVSAALAGSLEPARLYQIILEQAAHLLPVDTSCVFLIQDGWVVVAATWGQPSLPVGSRAFPMDERLRRRWPRAGDRPLYCPDMRLVAGRAPREPWVGEHEVRSIITVPLAIDGELVGVFDVASTRPAFYTERHVRLAATLGGQVAQALRNARLYAAEQERSRVAEELARVRQEQMREAEALAEVSAALATALEPATVYQVILQQAARVLPFDYAEIVLYQDGWAISVAGQGAPAVPPGTRLVPLDTGTETWQALASGRVQTLADTAEVPDWPEIPPWVGPHRIRSAIIVPLRIEGALIGSFEVNSFAPCFYTDQHTRVAALFGERATLAVRNARLYAAEQARTHAAEELAQLRSDFVTSVSHELRTPLTAIVGFATLLQERWDQTDERHRLDQVDKIVTAANRQRHLVEELLLLTRLDQGDMAPRTAAVDLVGLVRQATDEVLSAYPGQRIELSGPATLVVLADPERATQVLVNVLDNAAKYSPEGSMVTVSWGRGGGMGVVRVRDQGPGIGDKGRAVLFTRFGRVPGSRIRSGRVGTGLGLHISRRLAEAMHGDLDLEMTGPRGSVFRLRLPIHCE